MKRNRGRSGASRGWMPGPSAQAGSAGGMSDATACARDPGHVKRYGMDENRLLVEATTRISAEAVPLNQQCERLAGAPHDAPNLVDQRPLRDLYGHSASGPSWAATAVYPRSH
jgi:hypothetical protein